MSAIYSALDILCNASIFGEGFPNVIAEAMLCEVPCVVSNVGHSREVVGNCWPVVPPGNAEALADACRTLLQRTESDAAAAGRLGRERIVKAFSVEALVAATEAALRTIQPRVRLMRRSRDQLSAHGRAVK